jgi:tetratricopeptide (TPR) repeat protein
MGLKKFVFPLLVILALAACEDRKDRAERYYQNALSLLESGDADRAIIELKNVFDLMPEHHDARLAYANLVRRLGRTEEAYSQYLRLVEQYPDDLEGRIALTEIALDQQNWPEVERHGQKVIALAPDLPFSKAIDVALRYQKVLVQKDPALRRSIAA